MRCQSTRNITSLLPPIEEEPRLFCLSRICCFYCQMSKKPKNVFPQRKNFSAFISRFPLIFPHLEFESLFVKRLSLRQVAGKREKERKARGGKFISVEFFSKRKESFPNKLDRWREEGAERELKKCPLIRKKERSETF